MLDIAYALGRGGDLQDQGFNIGSLVPVLLLLGIVIFIVYRMKKKSAESNSSIEIEPKDEEKVFSIVNRPRSVSWLAWLIIGQAVLKFSLVLKSAAQIKLLFIQINRPDLFIVFIAIESVLFIIKIILAIGLLRGKNLARWLWLSFGLVYFVILLIALPSDFHGPISDTRFLGDIFKLLWIISLFILFKSDVTEYFYSASSVRRKNISE